MTRMVHVALAGLFAASLSSASAAFAQSGTTSPGGSTAGNAGSSGTKADKKMQTNAMSSNKKKQHK